MKKIIIFFLLFQNIFSQDNLPNFSVKLLNNQSSNLVSLTNEISLISFWATWCLPCIKEIDKINTFVKDYDNLSVILINRLSSVIPALLTIMLIPPYFSIIESQK